MRKLMFWLGAMFLTVALQAQDFTRTMTAEEQARAGLEKLSPAELAALKAAVERYKSGAVAVVQEQAEQKVAATEAKVKAAEQKAVVAEQKAQQAETKAAAATGAEKKSGPSWLRALVTLQKVEADPTGSEPLESRLATEFRGWRKGTVFELENGQRWQHSEADDYVTSPMPAPRVTITPGAFGTFWMKIEGVRPKLRVKPLKLE